MGGRRVQGAAAAASGQANAQVKAETVAKLAAVMSPAEKADVAKMTPGQLQHLANAAALPMSDVIKVMQEYGMARLLHQEVRIWKREGRPLPKTPSAFQEFLTSVMNRAKQQQVRGQGGGRRTAQAEPLTLMAHCQTTAAPGTGHAHQGKAKDPRQRPLPVRQRAQVRPVPRCIGGGRQRNWVAHSCTNAPNLQRHYSPVQHACTPPSENLLRTTRRPC